ncbi:hypothetical protein [Sporosarcina sp. P13]|nr:hypothetical protein [Sporosarcina sp. P13]
MKPNEYDAIIINPTPTVKVLKKRKGKPTVIEYGGLRFIQEQQPRSTKKK